jgi:hypothetical protein
MLLLASSVCGLFRWRQFKPEVILLALGWYLDRGVLLPAPKMHGANYQNRTQKRYQYPHCVCLRNGRNTRIPMTFGASLIVASPVVVFIVVTVRIRQRWENYRYDY